MYLLTMSIGNYNPDEWEETVHSSVIGIYNTIEECKVAVETDVDNIFLDEAEIAGMLELEAREYMMHQRRLADYYNLDDSSFSRVGACRYIADLQYEEKSGPNAVKYLVIKIS